MKPELKREFRAVILAIVKEYDAGREDVVAVAKELPEAPPRARGRPPTDDDHALADAARLRLSGRADSDWAAAETIAQQLPGHSTPATARRIYRHMRRPGWPIKAFFLLFPEITTMADLLDQSARPFLRAQFALAKLVRQKPPIGRNSKKQTN